MMDLNAFAHDRDILVTLEVLVDGVGSLARWAHSCRR